MKFLYCNHELVKMHIAEAVIMAGLPMSTSTDFIEPQIKELERDLLSNRLTNDISIAKRFTKAIDLGKAKPGSGHDCYLKGIVVTAVVTAPAYQWPQIQRYHFLDIISSQSKMHKITKMNIKEQCTEEVDDVIIGRLNDYISEYNSITAYLKEMCENPNAAQERIDKVREQQHKVFRKIVANAPQGLHLAAGIVTSYLQLKTMKLQRKGHPLEEWTQDFTAGVDALPYFKVLTGV